METRAESVVGVVLLASLDTVFTAVVDRGYTRHGVHESVYQRQVSVVVESACQTVYVMVVYEVVQVKVAVDTAVSA
jgi:hypothetical protein